MKLSTAWNWELGIGILEDNVFGQRQSKAAQDALIERRREPRISLSLPVRFRPKGRAKLSWFSARSIDVSRNGVRLALDRQVDVGQQIDLDIKLPDVEKTVRLEGVVVWSNPSMNGTMECGIAFKSLRQLTQREKIMYFMADKICSMADRNSAEFSCYPARTTDDLDNAYRLVYREYLQKNYCSQHPSGFHYTYYSLLPESRTFLLEKNSNFVGTISLVPDSEAGLPLEVIFPKEIASFRAPGRKLAEVSLLALDGESFERKTFSLTDFQKLTGSFRLFKALFDYARAVAGVTDLVIGMHPKHKELYRYLHFEPVGPVRSYPGAQGKPALLMRLDVDHTVKTAPLNKGAGSYFLRSNPDKKAYDGAFGWSAETVHKYLYERKELIRGLAAEQVEILKSCYPSLFILQNGNGE